jgi:hypothetical protein
MADGLGQPFSYPTASLPTPPVVIGGGGLNLQFPTFQGSAPQYYDVRAVPNVVPPVDYSNIIKGLATGIEFGTKLGAVPAQQRKNFLQNQLTGYVQDQMKQMQQPQQAGESTTDYQNRLNRAYTAMSSYQVDSAGNVTFAPKSAADIAQTLENIKRTTAETGKLQAETVTEQARPAQIQAMIDETKARTDLSEAQKTEIIAKLQNVLGFFSIKPDVPATAPKAETAPKTETKPKIGPLPKLTESTVTSKAGKSYKVRKDASGNVVGVFNPTTNQWETK